MGPVVEREGRLFGAPLNLTARLALHPRGGQILCTEPVAHEARGHPGMEARLVGVSNVLRRKRFGELR